MGYELTGLTELTGYEYDENGEIPLYRLGIGLYQCNNIFNLR